MKLNDKIKTFTPSQRILFDTIAKGGNVCCLGPGGTGKSYSLDAVIEYARQGGLNVLVCAPTGISALNLGGMTIHRAFGADFGILPNGSMMSNELIETADIVVIDEISMVRRDLFEYVVRSIRLANKRAKSKAGKIRRPFKQLVVCGDYGQLPPVLVPAEKDDYERIYDSRFAFTSPLWSAMKFSYVLLREVVRQKDKSFADKLERVRMGDQTVLGEFRQNVNPSENSVTLCTTNWSADEINKKMLSRLQGHHTYVATVWGEVEDSEMPADFSLTLAPGAHVMFVSNDRDGKWMNGSLATVLECHDECVEVEMHDGERLAIRPYTWNIYRTVVRKKDAPVANRSGLGRFEREKVGSFRQYPLHPAWAITVHKSQGQTYEEVNIAPGDFFDSGQLYVALSRCRTEEGLHITGALKASDLRVDKAVVDFLKSVNERAIN